MVARSSIRDDDNGGGAKFFGHTVKVLVHRDRAVAPLNGGWMSLLAMAETSGMIKPYQAALKRLLDRFNELQAEIIVTRVEIDIIRAN